MEKILVIAPHNQSILKAISDYSKVSDLEFVMIGSKEIINKICWENYLRIRNYELIDIEGEIEISMYAKSFIEKNIVKNIILGDIPYVYFEKIISCKEKDLEAISVVDSRLKSSYIFLSSGPKRSQVDFLDKKTSIIHASRLMNKLGIANINASIVYPKKKEDLLETKIIKMIMNELEINNLNITDYKTIKEVFNEENDGLNLILMKNYDSSRLFLDSLEVFTKSKVATFLLAKDIIAIDCEETSGYDNIFFSLFIMDKLLEKKIVSRAS